MIYVAKIRLKDNAWRKYAQRCQIEINLMFCSKIFVSKLKKRQVKKIRNLGQSKNLRSIRCILRLLAKFNFQGIYYNNKIILFNNEIDYRLLESDPWHDFFFFTYVIFLYLEWHSIAFLSKSHKFKFSQLHPFLKVFCNTPRISKH